MYEGRLLHIHVQGNEWEQGVLVLSINTALNLIVCQLICPKKHFVVNVNVQYALNCLLESNDIQKLMHAHVHVVCTRTCTCTCRSLFQKQINELLY